MKLLAMYPLARCLALTRKVICLTQTSYVTSSYSRLLTTPRLRSFLSSNRVQVSQARMLSLCRQNYPEECEVGVNRQINMEMYASYVYMSMAFYFNRDDVALPGLYKFFEKLAEEERTHTEKLMKYQNLRGGRIVLQDIKKPEVDAWGSGLEAMMSALKLEKLVNQSLLDLHLIAQSKNDVQFEIFLEEELLTEQVESIKEIADYVTQLKRVGPGLGEYMFDKDTLQEPEKRNN